MLKSRKMKVLTWSAASTLMVRFWLATACDVNNELEEARATKTRGIVDGANLEGKAKIITADEGK
jgi:hypothetical protein